MAAPALETAKKVVTNKWFWIIIAVIIILAIVYKIWRESDVFKDKFRPIQGDFSQAPISEQRKIDIRAIGRKWWDEAGSVINVEWGLFGTSDRNAILIEIMGLNDLELKYLAQWFQNQYSISLADSIDNEQMPNSDQDDRVYERLKKMNL